MRKLLLTTAACLFLASPLWADVPVKKSRKQLERENQELWMRVEQLQAELEVYRAEAAERAAIEEEISGENENKVSAALEDFSSASTDTLLARWYMHRSSRVPGREQYDMDSVHFTTDVPDSVLMKRLTEFFHLAPLQRDRQELYDPVFGETTPQDGRDDGPVGVLFPPVRGNLPPL